MDEPLITPKGTSHPTLRRFLGGINPVSLKSTDQSDWQGRACSLGLAWCILALAAFGSPPKLQAETPAPLPAYSAAATLRGDSSLHAVAFANNQTGLAVGDRGTILRSTDGGQKWQLVESLVDCRLDDVVWLSARQAVIVGGGYDPITQLSRAVVLRTTDAGITWKVIPNVDLPRLRQLQVGEHGRLVARGDWSHGTLASTFESHNGGQTWQASNESPPRRSSGLQRQQSTPDNSSDLLRWQRLSKSPAPIRDIGRTSPTGLCAVGDHGVIFTSDDEGQHWSPRRGGTRHCSVLIVGSSSLSVPWSLVGSESLQWRNRVSVLLERTMPESHSIDRQDVDALDLCHQAAVQLGASGVDLITPSRSLSTEAARWIAIHRPSVVVLDDTLSPSLSSAISEAAQNAGVRRVLQSSSVAGGSSRRRGTGSLAANSLLPHLGVIASDMTSDVFQLIAPLDDQCRFDGSRSVTLKQTYGLDAAAIGSGQTVVTGLRRRRGGQLTAKLSSASRHRLQTLQARLRQATLLHQQLGNASNLDQLRQWLKLSLDQTAKEDQLRLAWSSYGKLRGSVGEIAALDEITERFGEHSVASWTGWMSQVQLRSHEHQILQSLGTLESKAFARNGESRGSAASTSVVTVSPFEAQSIESADQGNYFDAIQQASAVSPIQVVQPDVIQAFEKDSPAGRSKQNGPRAVDLQFEFHPSVLLQSPTGQQTPNETNLDETQPRETEAELIRIIQSGTLAWSQLLRGAAGKQIIAQRVSSPPILDGVLNEDCWADSSRLPNTIPGDRTADRFKIQVAYDDRYVFFGVVCPSDLLPPDDSRAKARGRDQPLTQANRLQLQIDTDQDLWTSHQLETTDTGRTRDGIDGNLAWHPTWYVDSRRDAQNVTFEMAIRMNDLQTQNIQPHQSWYLSASARLANSATSQPIFPDPNRWIQVTFE